VYKAIYPSLDLALKNVYKLLLLLLGMGPRAPTSWRQSSQVHTHLDKAGSFANRPVVAGAFLAVRVSMTGLGD
jgi:hypothetical protein